MHCPIIAKVFHKINTFFEKIPNISLIFQRNALRCGGVKVCPQDVDAPKGQAQKENFVKRKIFAPKKPSRQNVHKEIITKMSKVTIFTYVNQNA